MILRISIKLALALVIAFASICSVKAQNKWLWDFEGTLGSEKIGFTLVSTKTDDIDRGDNLECSYFYVKYLKDIPLRCSIAQDGNVTFEELDKSGKVASSFRGKFLKNEIDNVEGNWTKNGETQGLPFKLRLLQGSGIAAGNRYEDIEAPDAAEFERKVQAFRQAVLNGDRRQVASFIKFPIEVRVGKKAVKIKNKAALLQNYDKIFYKEFVEEIRQTVAHNMFHRYDGAMLGRGSVWFWGNGKVIGINN
ncbi:MAG: hypothetical protein WA584_06880 [Pyrinomonadaceae bacterium]